MAESIKAALEAEQSGVSTGTHTGAAGSSAAPAGPDLFGKAPALIEGKPAGSRAGRPNRLNKVMAAKIEERHGTTVLEEVARLGFASVEELARGAIEAAKAIAEAMGAPETWKEHLGGLSVMGLLRFKADMLATAAPYLHAKRAPENASGQAAPVYMVLGGVTAADLGRSDGAITDDDMVIDLEAIALAPSEVNQGLSGSHADAAGDVALVDDENANNSKEIGQ